jgi:hypothetical protein
MERRAYEHHILLTMARTQVIGVRVTPTERRAIKERADSLGLSPGGYVRAALFPKSDDASYQPRVNGIAGLQSDMVENE